MITDEKEHGLEVLDFVSDLSGTVSDLDLRILVLDL